MFLNKKIYFICIEKTKYLLLIYLLNFTKKNEMGNKSIKNNFLEDISYIFSPSQKINYVDKLGSNLRTIFLKKEVLKNSQIKKEFFCLVKSKFFLKKEFFCLLKSKFFLKKEFFCLKKEFFCLVKSKFFCLVKRKFFLEKKEFL